MFPTGGDGKHKQLIGACDAKLISERFHSDSRNMFFQENGCRQKSDVCEVFDHLFALMEERKGEMILKINAEQEEKLDYIKGLRRKHNEHLETTAKLLEDAIQTLDESEVVVFLQVNVMEPDSSITHQMNFRNFLNVCVCV